MWSRFLASIDTQAIWYFWYYYYRFSCTKVKTLKAKYIDEKLTQNLRYIFLPFNKSSVARESVSGKADSSNVLCCLIDSSTLV